MQPILGFSLFLALCLVALQCVESTSIPRALSTRRGYATSLSRRGEKPQKNDNNEKQVEKDHKDKGSDDFDLCKILKSFKDRATVLSFFKAPFLDKLEELQVEKTFSSKCYSWLDKVAPDYNPSSPKNHYFDADKQYAQKLVCDFPEARMKYSYPGLHLHAHKQDLGPAYKVPGHPGLYIGTCAALQVKSIEWYEARDTDRAPLQTWWKPTVESTREVSMYSEVGSDAVQSFYLHDANHPQCAIPEHNWCHGSCRCPSLRINLFRQFFTFSGLLYTRHIR